MVWVKFHDKLCKGAKRGLSRAARFVFMELCLESRPGRGVLDLPIGMTDIDAIHDILGGNREELADAIKALIAVPKSTPNDPEPRAMVELTGEEGARRLTVPSWDTWNSGQESPGASTERSRRHRQRSASNEQNAVASQESNTAPPDATVVAPVANDDATPVQRSGNGSATPYRGEERREEEITHTSRARAQGEMVSAEDIAEVLRGIDALADLAKDTSRVRFIAGGFQMALGDLATLANAKRALGAFVAKELPNMPDASVAQLGAALGGFMTNQRPDRYRSRARDPDPDGSASSEARKVVDVFAEAWGAKKGRAFVRTEVDERKAADLVGPARDEGLRLGIPGSAVIRHRAAKYLADTDPFVADKDHPFALFVARINQYESPKPKKAPLAKVPTEAPSYVPAPPELAAKLASIGKP